MNNNKQKLKTMKATIKTSTLQSKIEMLMISQQYMSDKWFEFRFTNLKILSENKISIN